MAENWLCERISAPPYLPIALPLKPARGRWDRVADSKAVCMYMGHASIAITLDLYGHLMPGSEKESANLLDAYFVRERATAQRSVESQQFPG